MKQKIKINRLINIYNKFNKCKIKTILSYKMKNNKKKFKSLIKLFKNRKRLYTKMN